MLHATTVSTREELLQIKKLQQQYLRGHNDKEEERSQGFVTVDHSLEMLQQMHRFCPSVIVKDDDKLVGYALVMFNECKQLIPVLVPMFELFEKISYNDQPLSDYRFYVMGQVCIDKAYRGKNVFDLLYNKHRELFRNKFDFVVTEISLSNKRSLKAHERVGFKTIHRHKDPADEWAVVLWDWS